MRRLPFALLCWLVPALASADAVMMVVNADDPDEGFNDPTPAAPVGGNGGTTLGEQRLIAFQYAADVWGRLLDSEVPIVIEARFDPLDCDDGAVLGVANTVNLRANFQSAPVEDTWYPAALADRLARVDLDPEEADVVAWFNSDLDRSDCLGRTGFYYGLDGNAGDDIELITVALHEIAHGLGSAIYLNLETGVWPGDDQYPTIAGRFTYDRELGKHWHEMDAGELIASSTNVRQVLWDGPGVIEAMPDHLDTGMPAALASPEPTGFSGAVGLAEFGPPLQAPGVTGELVYVDDGVVTGDGSTTDGCEPFDGVSGKLALIDRGECFFTQKVANAQDAGAIAVLIADWEPGAPPVGMAASPDPPTIDIPSVRVSLDDGTILKTALMDGPIQITLGIDDSRLTGEALSSGGGLLINAVDPLDPGSSISHWDPIATPNLLMEPAINPDLDHGVDVTLGQMRDIGWHRFECGNGTVEPGEQCDDAEVNSDTAPDACRTDCRDPRCGDGVRDGDEECDDGGSSGGDGCSASCVVEFCGDGVINDGDELCDQGIFNSDTAADRCREDCRPARCGDGVVDSGESCDDGPANTNGVPGACRTTCLPAFCGDGILDDGERCDDAGANSDEAADACRSDCRPARCGDGVIDSGEACDDGKLNGDALPNVCRSDCTPPRCGDGVRDHGEECDDGNLGAGDGCDGDCAVERREPEPPRDAASDGNIDGGSDAPAQPDAALGDAGAPDDAGSGRDPDGDADGSLAARGDAEPAPDAGANVEHVEGCGCRTVGAAPHAPGPGAAATLLLLAPAAMRLRRRRRS